MTRRMNDLIQRLRGAARPDDSRLLADYLSGRSPTALGELVHRHAPMVWGVCRRIVGHHQDAEDAFQATFLVLVRKAATLSGTGSLAGWIHAVARKTALKARATAARRYGRERPAEDGPEPAARPVGELLLDQELEQLPEVYRVAVLLCDLQGLTRREAAAQLGVPEGTLASRLARGRGLLARRLGQQPAPLAVLPPVLLTQAVSPAAVALCEEVLQAMTSSFPPKLAALVGFSLLVVSAVLAFAPAPAPEEKPAPRREELTLKLDHPVTAIVCSADHIAAGDAGGNVYLYDARTGKDRRQAVKGGKSFTSVDRLQLQPDGKWLWAVFNGRKAMFQIDLQKAGLPAYGAGPANLGVSVDGGWWLDTHNPRLLVIRPNLHHLDKKPGRHHDSEDSIRFGDRVLDAIFSPDTRWLAAQTADDQLRVYDWASPTRNLRKSPEGTPVAKQKANAFQFSPDGKRLAVVGPGRFARLYDPDSGKEVATLRGHRGAVSCVAFSPDGKTVVTGGAEDVLRFHDATGRPLGVLKGHGDAIRAVAFGPDGKTLVTGSADRTLKVWRPAR